MFDANKLVESYLNESLELAENQKELSDTIKEVSLLCIKCIDSGGKLILFGNGGSASDSQHIAAELVGRFQLERKALPAISLSSNISVVTALANDFGYENIFLKQIEALATDKDLLIALSTSGQSQNILDALNYSKGKGIKSIGLTGQDPGGMESCCDYLIKAPSSKPSLIQQSHITIGQLLCLIIEDYFFNK
tara:strand:- start:824 stop:1402 length:579 start_codon:yes stop_codon:yes gene_type:complete